MKGYRTIAFSIATILLGLLGRHVAPDLINAYLDVIFAAVGLGFIVLRMVTDTPFGQKIAKDLGTSPAAIQNLVATLDPDSQATLNSAVGDLNAAVERLSGHPLLAPDTAQALINLAGTIRDGGAAPSPAGAQNPGPTPAPSPAPVVTAAPAAAQA